MNLAASQRGECLFHDRNAFRHGKELFDLCVIQDKNLHLVRMSQPAKRYHFPFLI